MTGELLLARGVLHVSGNSRVMLAHSSELGRCVLKRPRRPREAIREFNLLSHHVTLCRRVSELAYGRLLSDEEIDWGGNEPEDYGVPDHPANLVIKHLQPVARPAVARTGWMGDDEVARELWPAVACVLDLAENSDVIHGDIKPSNFVRTGSAEAVLIDFGRGGLLHQGDPGGHMPPRGGTATYASPEWLRGGVAGQVSDVYALGVMLFALCNGMAHPYEIMCPDLMTMGRREAIGVLRENNYAPKMWRNPKAPLAADLASKILDPDPGARITARGVTLHPLFTGSAKKR